LSKPIKILLVIILVIAGIFASGCLSENEDTSKSTGSENIYHSQTELADTDSQEYQDTDSQEYQDTGSHNSQDTDSQEYQDTDSQEYQDQKSSYSSQGTQGVDNTYTLIDTDFDYEYGATDLMYHADLMKGDTVEVEATSNLPVNFISGDDQFYQSYLMGSGNVNSFMNDGMDKGSVYQEESYSGATYYSLNKEMNRKSFNLIIQNPEGDSSLEGHIKIVVHSQYTKSEHDSGDGY